MNVTEEMIKAGAKELTLRFHCTNEDFSQIAAEVYRIMEALNPGQELAAKDARIAELEKFLIKQGEEARAAFDNGTEMQAGHFRRAACLLREASR